jgi:hypothetical protein
MMSRLSALVRFFPVLLQQINVKGAYHVLESRKSPGPGA